MALRSNPFVPRSAGFSAPGTFAMLDPEICSGQVADFAEALALSDADRCGGVAFQRESHGREPEVGLDGEHAKALGDSSDHGGELRFS